jgi:hypothetical protein
MPQTFYIENDEEIISVIGRLRRSSSEENYFVFPKRALVLQSIVNLRLFQREAEKLGKRIVIVTQDEAGMLLAEKAGLMAERYTDDFSRAAEHIELTPEVTPAPLSAIKPTLGGLRSQDIGSSDFYGGGIKPPKSAPAREPVTPGARTLRIRNATPDRPPSLNSKRFDGAPSMQAKPAPQGLRPQIVLPIERSMPVVPPTPSERGANREATQTVREARLRNFFTQGGVPRNESEPKLAGATPSSAPRISVTSPKAGRIFAILGGISLLSLIGVGTFLFLPKAEVHVVPYRTVQEVDLPFEGRADVEPSDTLTVPVRIIEKEQKAKLSVEATGTAAGTTQKARGTIAISNTFSSDPQSLVATTRFETADGKVFRLTEGVTVPGMKGTTPGTIEASVIADQTGTSYNISSGTFTIPGFKGSPKYDKFSARIVKAMAGGSDGSGSANQTVIAKSDLEKASLEARTRAREVFLESAKSELLPGERILEENLDIISLSDATLPLSGTVATSFEYENSYRIRGFVYSEEAIKQYILSQGKNMVSGVSFQPVDVVLSYGEAVPDFDARTVKLKTHAKVISESVINRDVFEEAILGKDEQGIDDALTSFPEIKKIEIVFKPQWFTRTVPSSNSRVTVLIEPGQE